MFLIQTLTFLFYIKIDLDGKLGYSIEKDPNIELKELE